MRAAIILFLFVATAYCQDYEDLYYQLFDEGASTLAKEEVLDLLKQIKPLVPESSDNDNQLVRREVDFLINMNNNADGLCTKREEFVDHFETIRGVMKTDLGITKTRINIYDWNKNIDNYITQCLSEQLKRCLNSFVKHLNLSQEESEIIDRVSSNVDGFVGQYKKSEPKTKKLFGDSLSEEEYERQFNILKSTCSRIFDVNSGSSLINWAEHGFYATKLDLGADEEFSRASKHIDTCAKFS